MTRRRTLLQELALGFVVVALAVLGGALVYSTGRRGIDAIRDGAAEDAIVLGLVALGSVMIPVVALALFLHWVGTTSRSAHPSQPHIPTLTEEILVGIAVLAVVVVTVAAVMFSYRRAVEAFDGRDLAFAVGYGLLGAAAVAFAIFCIERYVRWLRE